MVEIEIVDESHEEPPKRFLNYDEAVNAALKSSESEKPKIIVYY